MKKTIKSNEINGFILAQMRGANSISFAAELPKNAKVDYIRLIGNVEVNGTPLENPVLDDIDGVVVSYHKELSEIATAYFVDGIPQKLLADVQNYVLADFEIECIEVCPCCGK